MCPAPASSHGRTLQEPVMYPPHLSVSPVGGARALRLEGELDISNANLLVAPLQQAVEAGGPVFLDLTSLTFMDSSGVHAILAAAAALHQSGWCLYLHVGDGEVSRVIDLMELAAGPNIHVVSHPDGHLTPGDRPADEIPGVGPGAQHRWEAATLRYGRSVAEFRWSRCVNSVERAANRRLRATMRALETTSR